MRGGAAGAIDAPFSIPWWFFGQSIIDHRELLIAINGLRLNSKIDFPTGNEFIACVAAGIPFQFTKPLRVTESYWRGRSVNIRSAVWSGYRPGAPFASACIKLLANAARPLWPWAHMENSPLIEAFPAAQLCHWGLPFERFNGLAGQVNRAAIVADLVANRGLQMADTLQAIILENADALDAVLCCYAARAVVQNQMGVPLPPQDAWRLEEWIAVHG